MVDVEVDVEADEAVDSEAAESAGSRGKDECEDVGKGFIYLGQVPARELDFGVDGGSNIASVVIAVQPCLGKMAKG